MNYFATPISSQDSFANYTKTVLNGIDQETLKEFEFLTGSFDNVFKRFQDKNKKIRLWGIKSDKLTRWEKINPGDVLFFYRNKYMISWCRVLDKFENTDIATILWGSFESKHYPRYTWPLIIVLDKPKTCNIPFSVFNKILGYADNYFLRSFFKLGESLKKAIDTKYEGTEGFVSKESIQS